MNDKRRFPGSNVNQPSDTDSISPIIAAALFGDSGISSIDQLSSANGKTGSIAKNIADIADIVTGKATIFTNIQKFESCINDVKTSVSTLNNALVNEKITVISQLINIEKTIVDKTDKLISELSKNLFQNNTSTNENIEATVSVIMSGFDGTAIKELSKLANVKLDKNSLLSTESLDKFKEYFTQLNEIFKLQAEVGANATLASKANQAIIDGLDDSAEVVVCANENEKIFKQGTLSIQELGVFIVRTGFTLMICSLFMMIPGMIQNTIKFTIALSLFLAGVLSVITLISAIGSKYGQIETDLENLTDLVTAGGFILMLGALFMMIPNITTNALKFTLVLTMFFTAVFIPFIMLNAFDSKNAMHQIQGIERLMLASVIIMSIGSLFVLFGGGKFIKSALQFGLVLTTFIGLILLPIMLFEALIHKGNNLIKNVTSFIVACTFVMLVGAMFMYNKDLVAHSLGFGLLLGTFITLILLPLMIYSFLNKRATMSLVGFTSLVFVSTIVMLIGAYFVSDWDIVKRTLGFTVLLGLFIMGVLTPLIIYSKFAGPAKVSLYALTTLIAVTSAMLIGGALVVDKYGWAALGYATLLWAFISGITRTLAYVAKHNKLYTAAAKALLQISFAIGIISASITILTVIGKEFGWNNVLAATAFLGAVVFGLVKLFENLNKNAVTIKQGRDVSLSISLSLLPLSVAIGIIAVLGKEYGWDQIVYGVITLGLIACGFSLLYNSLTSASAGVATGAVVILAISASIAILTATLGLITILGDTYGWGQVFAGVGALAATVAIFGVLYWGLTAISAGVAVGSGVLLAISASIGVMSLVVWGIVALVDKYGEEKILSAPGVLSKFILNLSKVFLAAIPAGISAVLASSSILLMMPTVLGISSIIVSIGRALQVYKNAVDGKENIIDNVKTTIKGFMSISDVAPNLIEFAAMIVKLNNIKEITSLTSEIVGQLTTSIKEFVDLKIATKWNKYGVPTDYIRLSSNDFIQAATGIGLVLTTLTGAIAKTYTENKDKLFGNNLDKILKNVKKLSTTEGEILSTLSESIKSYAQLLIPIRWNKDGKAVAYRPMIDDDFTHAAIGIGKILTTMAEAIKNTYTENKDDLFGKEFNTILKNVKKLSIAEGEILSTLSEGIQSYAQLLIPTRWNKNGKAVAYRPMTITDFENAAKNIGAVMSLMALSIASIIDGKKHTLNINGKNVTIGYDYADKINDTVLNKIGNIAKSFIPMGELIGSLAGGMAAYAVLQIPVKWDGNGRAIGFKQMSPELFKRAADNIGLVITTLASSIDNAYELLNSFWSFTSIDEKINAFKPMGELISSLAEGMSAYAALQIPTAWDANGKPIKFATLNKPLFKTAGDNITTIITTMLFGDNVSDKTTSGIIGAYNIIKTMDLDDKIQSIIESFVPVGELLDSMCKGISGFAKLLIPDQWDPKTGQPIHFTKLSDDDFKTAGKNINDVCVSIIQALVEVVKKNPDYFGEKSKVKFATVIDSVKNVGDIIHNIAEGINTFAKGGIPTYNSEGKIIGYTQLKPEDYITMSINISNVMSAMVKAIIKAGKDINILENGEQFNDSIDSVLKIGNVIKNIAEGIQAWADMKMPIGWNADGSVKGYKSISNNDIIKAKTNISTIIVSLAEAMVKVYNTTIDNVSFKDFSDSDIIPSILSVTNSCSNVIKKVADIIKSIGEMRIPTGWNADGSVKKYIKIDDTEINKFNSVLTTLLTNIPTTMKSIYDNNKTVYGQDFIETLNSMISTIDSIKTVSSTIFELISYYNKNAETVKSFFNYTSPNKLTLCGDIHLILEDITNIIKLISDNTTINSIKIDNVQQYINMLSQLNELANTLLQYTVSSFVDNIPYITDLFKYNSTHTKADASIKIKLLSDVYTIFNDFAIMQQNISKTEIALNDSTVKKLQKMLTLFVDINETLNTAICSVINNYDNVKSFISKNKNENREIRFDTLNDIYEVIKDITAFMTLLQTDEQTPWYDKIFGQNKFDSKKLENLNSQITSFKTVFGNIIASVSEISKQHNVIKQLHELTSIYGINQSEFKTPVLYDVYCIVNDVITLVNSYNNKINNNDLQLGNILSELGTGLFNLSVGINNYEEPTKFKTVADEVNKFIKNTVNEIDVEKIDRLISLTASLNNLADKTTNLDTLTNAIADNLTISLNNLVGRMEESKMVIMKSEEIQQKRHQVIAEIIKEMRNVMTNQIDVVISVKDNASNSFSSSSDGGYGNTTQTTSGGTNSASSSTAGSGNVTIGGTNNSKQQTSNNTQTTGTDKNKMNELIDQLNRINKNITSICAKLNVTTK